MGRKWRRVEDLWYLDFPCVNDSTYNRLDCHARWRIWHRKDIRELRFLMWWLSLQLLIFLIWLFKLSRVNVENDISNDCFGSCKSLRDDKLYIFTGLRFFVGLAVHAGKFRKNYFIHLNIDRLGHESTVLFVLWWLNQIGWPSLCHHLTMTYS